MAELPELLVPDAAVWRQWLTTNHASSPGVGLVLHKKGGSVTSIVYATALDEALCFGWIDGHVKGRDEGSYTQRFTPRGPRSSWSARNVSHIARLEAAGLMHASGRAAVDAAKADGRWDAAYAGPATATVPDDLATAIAAVPAAQEWFNVLTSQNRYAFLYRLATLKTEAARARNIEKFVGMLARGELFHPQQRRPS